jgi:hypothetical protein
LTRKEYFVCDLHSELFDNGDNAIIMNCRGDKCRRKISYSEHGIWCTACNFEFNPFWKYDLEENDDSN